MNLLREVKYIKGAVTNGRMTLNTTWLAVSAVFSPLLPTVPAMAMLGIIEMVLVTSRRTHGLTVQLSMPSDTIWPAMVQMIPADIPDRRRARAKTVPAAGPRLFLRRS